MLFSRHSFNLPLSASNVLFPLQQYDAVSYINDTMKDSSEVSKFRKDRLAGDGNGITFW